MGNDAEEWAKVAGTFPSQKKTYQITGTETNEEMTGLGSLRDTKEMRIEFDVFKKLSHGQAVLIDKAFHREDLFQVWRPVFMKKVAKKNPKQWPKLWLFQKARNPLKTKAFHHCPYLTTPPHHYFVEVVRYGCGVCCGWGWWWCVSVEVWVRVGGWGRGRMIFLSFGNFGNIPR